MRFYCFSALKHRIVRILRIFFPSIQNNFFRVFRVIRSLNKKTARKDPFNPSDSMFLPFNIEQFNMRPRRTIQHSTFLLWQAAKPITTLKIQKAAAILADRSSPTKQKIL